MKNLKTSLDVQNKAFYSLGTQHGRRVTKVCGHWNWIELTNYLYLAFELGRTAKTSRAPRMFRVEDTLSPTSPTTHV